MQTFPVVAREIIAPHVVALVAANVARKHIQLSSLLIEGGRMIVPRWATVLVLQTGPLLSLKIKLVDVGVRLAALHSQQATVTVEASLPGESCVMRERCRLVARRLQQLPLGIEQLGTRLALADDVLDVDAPAAAHAALLEVLTAEHVHVGAIDRCDVVTPALRNFSNYLPRQKQGHLPSVRSSLGRSAAGEYYHS